MDHHLDVLLLKEMIRDKEALINDISQRPATPLNRQYLRVERAALVRLRADLAQARQRAITETFPTTSRAKKSRPNNSN